MNTSNASPAPVSYAIATGNRYFVITLTNFPNLLERTQQYQQSPNQQWHQRLRGGMLIPYVPIHFGIAHTEEHETLLYNTLRFQLEESIRAYLQRTRRSYPINVVLDLSNLFL